MSTALSSVLPPPSRWTQDSDEEEDDVKTVSSERAIVSKNQHIPPYGSRIGWIPRKVQDFGDGGAFPEIHVAQFPLELGRKREKTSNALPVQFDSEGKIKYDVVLRQGKNKDKVIYSSLKDLLPSEVLNEEDETLAKPTEDEIEEITARTKQALESITQSKISAALPVRCAEKTAPAQYVRYTPANQGDQFNSGADQRIIRMVEVQKDPLEPPRFKINKKIPAAPPSPPPPVMHSPTRKVTVKEQQEWRIPPCISNWKNQKGYTIPLDKRLAADGRGLQQVHINEKFAKLSEALYVADRKAREAVELRAQMERKVAQKEKEKKEEHLRMLAQKAREERAGIRGVGGDKDDDVDEEIEEREQIRHDRHKERQRERNLQRAAPDKRNRLERQKERDISEKIALGMAKPKASGSEVQFDQRLFNQSKGVASGFGEDDDYAVYDKPWRTNDAVTQNIYRPSKSKDEEVYGDDLESLKTSRFAPEKSFSGVDPSAKRSGPVQFEKRDAIGGDEEDPFGLDKFLTAAKKASKRPNDDSDSRSKRRKD